jgi:molybdopterin synthase sulfur carrier subunit
VGDPPRQPAMCAPPRPQAPPAAPATITVRVRLFAGLREAMGWGERSVTSTAGATALNLWQQLGLNQAVDGGAAATGAGVSGAAATGGAVRSGLSDAGLGPLPLSTSLPAGIRVAVNQRFAGADAPLAEGDELAFLPPISGG